MKGCIKVGDAQRSVRDALKRVNGVADVIIFGERKYSMHLWLDPDRLAARALTIAVSVGISAFNALTLAPSLSALLLARERPRGHVFSAVNWAINGSSAAFVWVLRRLVAHRAPVLAVFGLGLVATWWVSTKVPTGFVPDEDPGYFFVMVQGPSGASLECTSGITRQAEQIMRSVAEIDAVFTVNGFSFLGSGSNRATLFARLRPFDERPGEAHSATSVVQRLYMQFGGITGAVVLPFLPPPIQGIGRFGGFTFEVLDLAGGSIDNLAAATDALVAQGNGTPGLNGLFSSFAANDPQLTLTVDHERAIKSAERALASARAAADQARQVVDIVNISFRAGATTNIEVLDAQRDSRNADTAAEVADDQLRQARLALLVALGRFPE